MAAHGARRLGRMVENLNVILGVEAICAAQGVEFRAPLPTSAPLQAVVARLRQESPRWAMTATSPPIWPPPAAP